MTDKKVAIIGAGMIGRAWAVTFARVGLRVSVWSRDLNTAHAATDFARDALHSLAVEGLLGDRCPEELGRRITVQSTIEAAVEDAVYVQENLPENLELKCEAYRMLDGLCAADAILASSTSGFPASAFTRELAGRGRCLVAHPINPPFLIPATEIVPSPWTETSIVARACEILASAGQKPVVLTREIDGFVANRLQGALLNEAFRLVDEGVAGIEDIDIAIREGLALRWSVIGPFETIDLNAPGGVRDYVARYDELYAHLLKQMEGKTDWSGDVLDVVETARRSRLPIEAHEDRQVWRDRRLMALAAHKREAAMRFGE